MNGLADADLIARVGDRDEAALRELFDRHAPWLALRLRRRTSSADLVNEALHDTFLGVWNKPGSFRGDGEVGAWLWGIAIRQLIDRLRRHAPPTPVTQELMSRHVAASVSAEDELLVGIEHGDLGAAMRALSPELRRAMQVTVLDGLSTREAALLLDIPQGTVKSRVRLAKVQLRQHLIAAQEVGP